VGTKVYCDVVGFEHAKKVADLGADGLIAVAFGAGGHAGDISPLALIPNLARMIKLPIIAAGSIVDGAGMAAAFALGASAVYMGTRFIASKEAEVAEKYKNTIVGAVCEDIVNTDRVDGFPGNFIRTKELEALGLEKGLIEEILTKNKRIKRFISLSRAARALFGATDSKVSYKTVYSAGHGVGLIDKVLSIQEIMEKTVKEYKKIKTQLP
jgi:nitronate monooxygenase